MTLPESTKTRDHSIEKATLLFVDDERRVLTSMRAVFRRDYHVFIADGGHEALEIIEREDIDVVISDQRMPKMTGVEFLCAVKQRAPDAMRILLTGYADLDAIEASINDGEVFRYLMKPCPPDDLKKAIRMAVDAARVGLKSSAELIPFPSDRQSRSRPAEPLAVAEQPGMEQSPEPAAPVPTATEPTASSAAEDRVEILVLTSDKELFAAIRSAAGRQRRVTRAVSVDQAMKALTEQSIGVMVTDMTVDGQEVEALTKTLKAEVPELVTVIASDRSDAHTLISLINEGQIYRFLLKPVSQGQCLLWIGSAVRKYIEMSNSSTALSSDQASGTGTFRAFGSKTLNGRHFLKLFRSALKQVRKHINRTPTAPSDSGG